MNNSQAKIMRQLRTLHAEINRTLDKLIETKPEAIHAFYRLLGMKSAIWWAAEMVTSDIPTSQVIEMMLEQFKMEE